MIDKSRAAMGWNRLPAGEQNIAIVTWFEILSDAGVPPSRYVACYRAAQQRESERRAQGKDRQIVTPNDLAVEWAQVRRMNDELDDSRLLPENAAAACQRCFGTGKEEMLDGTVRPDCDHLPFTEGELRERAAAKARSAEMMRAALKKIGTPKPVERPVPPPVDKGERLRCSSCERVVWTGFGFEEGVECNDLLNRATFSDGSGGELKVCKGTLEVNA